MADLETWSSFGILHWSMQCFCMNMLYMSMVSFWSLGGIFEAMEHKVPLVVGGLGFKNP